MRGRTKPKPVEALLPDLWRVVGELKRLTEGLEESLAAERDAKEARRGQQDDR